MLTRFMYFPGHKVASLKACDMRKYIDIINSNIAKLGKLWLSLF